MAKCSCLCVNLFLALFSLLTCLTTGLVKVCSIFHITKKKKYHVPSNLHGGNEEMLIVFSDLPLSSCVKFCGNLCSGFHLSKPDLLHLTI